MAGRYCRRRRDRHSRTGRDRGTCAAALYDRCRRSGDDRPDGDRPSTGARRMSPDSTASPAASSSAAPVPGAVAAITVTGLPGLPEITAGANLAELIVQAAPDLAD